MLVRIFKSSLIQDFSDEDILTVSELRGQNRIKVNYRLKGFEVLQELLKNYERLLIVKGDLKKYYQKGYDYLNKEYKE